MRPTLLIATLSMVLAPSAAFSKSELETLRALCQEQKRQINELEEANERLRSVGRETHAVPVAKTGANSTSPTANNGSTSTYTVKAGDTIERIARTVGTKPETLAKANGITINSIIRPGQKLKVTNSTSSAAAKTQSPSNLKTTHKVQAGDTFISISKKHGVSPKALAAANPKVNATSLRPGQMVSLGGNAPATTTISTPERVKAPALEAKASSAPPAPATKLPAPVPSRAAVSAPAPSEEKPLAAATPSPIPEKKIRPVTIEGEMTYGEFAIKHGTDAERLNALNGLDLTTATVLAKGSELYVPAQP